MDASRLWNLPFLFALSALTPEQSWGRRLRRVPARPRCLNRARSIEALPILRVCILSPIRARPKRR